MSEDIEQADALSAEAKAAQLGWTPLESWQGNPEAWVDAEEFVRRGETIMPILRKNNDRLASQVASLQSEIAALNTKLANGQESMQAMRELQEQEIRRAVERTRAELRSGIRQARESGDVDTEESLREQLTLTGEQIKNLDEVKAQQAQRSAQPAPPVLDSHTAEWLEANPWFRQDTRRTLVAVALSEAMAREGKRPSKSFYAELDTELAKQFPQPSQKVEGGSSGASGRGGASSKSYAALPADARAQCDADFNPKLVGEGRMFATKAEYQSYWTKLYHAGE